MKPRGPWRRTFEREFEASTSQNGRQDDTSDINDVYFAAVEMIKDIDIEVMTLKEFRALLMHEFPGPKELAEEHKKLLGTMIREEIEGVRQDLPSETSNMTKGAMKKAQGQAVLDNQPLEHETPSDVQAHGPGSTQEDRDHLLALRLQEQEESDSRRPPRRASAAAKTAAKRRVGSSKTKAMASPKNGVETTEKKKGGGSGGGFPPCYTSPALRRMLDGQERISSAEAIKQVWQYIKRHGLQDPRDKRFILIPGPSKSGPVPEEASPSSSSAPSPSPSLDTHADFLKVLGGARRVKMTQLPGKISRNLYPMNQ